MVKSKNSNKKIKIIPDDSSDSVIEMMKTNDDDDDNKKDDDEEKKSNDNDDEDKKKDDDGDGDDDDKKNDDRRRSDSDNSVSTTRRRKSKTSRILKQIDTFRERVDKGKQSLTSLVESFMGRGDEIDDQKLEDALEKYDEIVEEIEADFTKAKISIGLRVEDALKRFNQTSNDFMFKFSGINDEFIEWSNANRARFLARFRKRLLSINDFLTFGVERLLEMSERGKETIRRIHKRHYQKRASIFDFLRM